MKQINKININKHIKGAVSGELLASAVKGQRTKKDEQQTKTTNQTKSAPTKNNNKHRITYILINKSSCQRQEFRQGTPRGVAASPGLCGAAAAKGNRPASLRLRQKDSSIAAMLRPSSCSLSLRLAPRAATYVAHVAATPELLYS